MLAPHPARLLVLSRCAAFLKPLLAAVCCACLALQISQELLIDPVLLVETGQVRKICIWDCGLLLLRCRCRIGCLLPPPWCRCRSNGAGLQAGLHCDWEPLSNSTAAAVHGACLIETTTARRGQALPLEDVVQALPLACSKQFLF